MGKGPLGPEEETVKAATICIAEDLALAEALEEAPLQVQALLQWLPAAASLSASPH